MHQALKAWIQHILFTLTYTLWHYFRKQCIRIGWCACICVQNASAWLCAFLCVCVCVHSMAKEIGNASHNRRWPEQKSLFPNPRQRKHSSELLGNIPKCYGRGKKRWKWKCSTKIKDFDKKKQQKKMLMEIFGISIRNGCFFQPMHIFGGILCAITQESIHNTNAKCSTD